MKLIELNDIKGYVDFWNYGIGCNAIPANTRIKKTWIKWSEYQYAPIPEATIEAWKNNRDYGNGIAIIAGKIYKGRHEGRYLTFIDCDSKAAIDTFLEAVYAPSLEVVGKKWIVEQHRDDPNKAHIYFLSQVPIPNKAANKLGLEIKSENPGVAYCTPGIHKNGYPYEIMGTYEPEVMSNENMAIIFKRLAEIYKRHNITYERKEYLPQKKDEPQYTKSIPKERVNKWARGLAKFYVKGQVHDLVWAVAGMCRKEGIPMSQAEQIITKMGELRGDSPEWIRKHIEEVRQTYSRDFRKPIVAYSRLKELTKQ